MREKLKIEKGWQRRWRLSVSHPSISHVLKKSCESVTTVVICRLEHIYLRWFPTPTQIYNAVSGHTLTSSLWSALIKQTRSLLFGCNVYWAWGEGRSDSCVNHKDFVHDKQVAVVMVVEGVGCVCVCRVSSEQSLSVLVITETALSWVREKEKAGKTDMRL